MKLSHIFIAILIISSQFELCYSDIPPTKTAKAKPCSTLEYRQFDFWLGKWEVKTPDGKLAGHNHIESILGGCALRENWEGAKGSQGTSVNIYDKTNQQWHQTWVDDRGQQLKLSGNLSDRKMILTGDIASASEPKTLTRHKISWEQQADGRIKQLWTGSTDNGKTWKIFFEGLYSRQKATTSKVGISMDTEINHLLDFISQSSNCTFIRNNDAHSTEKALSHIRKKYNYYKDDIKNTEDFIRYSASQSSISKKPYLIQCKGNAKKMESRLWLLNELNRFRTELSSQ